ncbi:Alpha/Beta hydrolase protein [Phlebopus sp. FC_14]|nr:Alpha/Beta hydrolase protein [Phlebopus sp. FC_14]
MLRDSLRIFYHAVNATSPATSSQRKSVTSLLRDYDTPGVFPPSARIDRTLKLQNSYSLKFWDAWKYPAFAVNKVSSLARDILSHHIWGPRRRTWGIEMTIISSLMRDVSRHSALADIAMVRMVMGLAGLVPLPADALVTPVTFRVRRRRLRGILRSLDEQETGLRELSGEWIVGKKLWQTMQSNYKSNNWLGDDEPVMDDSLNLSHTSSIQKRHSRVILYIHGGAYYSSSAAAQRMITIPLSKYTDARVFAVDYRLAPETCFPGPLHDVVSAYLRLTDDLQVPPENIVVAGDSAGGGLCLALLFYLRDCAYSLPGGAILFSPWVDLTLSCPSWETNAAYDIVPTPGPTAHLHPVVMYLGDGLEDYLTHPYASPLFGKFEALPPLLIQCGEAEVLRDEIILLAHKASLAGVHVQQEMYEDAVHVFQSFPFLSSVSEAFTSCREFVRRLLPEIQSFSPRVLGNVCEARLDDEMDNENVRVVRGDGVETSTGRRDVQEEMKQHVDHPCFEHELPSWTPNRRNRTCNFCDSGTEEESPRLQISSSSGIGRINSTLSVLVADTSLTKVSDGPQRLGSSQRSPSFPLTSMSTRPSRMSKISSHPNITSFVEQWTLSPSNCSIPHQAKVNT